MNFKPFAAACAVALVTASSLPAEAGSRAAVRVVNNSSVTVVSIVSSAASSREHGTIDVLGRWTLRPGYNVEVDFHTADAENECLQDVMATGANGTKWHKRMNVCRISTWTLGD